MLCGKPEYPIPEQIHLIGRVTYSSCILRLTRVVEVKYEMGSKVQHFCYISGTAMETHLYHPSENDINKT